MSEILQQHFWVCCPRNRPLDHHFALDCGDQAGLEKRSWCRRCTLSRPWLASDISVSGQDGHHHPGKMQVEAVLPLTETYGDEAIANILTIYIAHSEDKIQQPRHSPAFPRSGFLSYAFESLLSQAIAEWGAMELEGLGTVFVGCA